jgi:hypothetical protein
MHYTRFWFLQRCIMYLARAAQSMNATSEMNQLAQMYGQWTTIATAFLARTSSSQKELDADLELVVSMGVLVGYHFGEMLPQDRRYEVAIDSVCLPFMRGDFSH